MRIGERPLGSLHAPSPGAPAREVEPTRTPVTRGQLRGAIERALTREDGAAPPAKLVDVLTAHASLETASGDRMFNFNFGGIKGASPSGATTRCRTREVLGGKEVVIRDGFRAYASLDEGALDYVRTMRARFGAAMAPAAHGDVVGFAGALKRAGYYTASEADYARGLGSLMGIEVSSEGAPSAIAQRHVSAPTTAQLSRIEGALDATRWLDVIGQPSLPSRTRSHGADDDDV